MLRLDLEHKTNKILRHSFKKKMKIKILRH